MIADIRREELKQKIHRGDRFILVETLHPDLTDKAICRRDQPAAG